MKLFDSVGPNPRTVRIFAAEKGLELMRERVDLRGGENRREPYLTVNPVGQLPALMFDDGSVLTEVTAICEYLEETHPTPPLIGTTARERAETRMWVRRIDLNIIEPMANGFRYSDGLKMFENRIHCIPQAAADLKAIAAHWLGWLDGQMTGKTFICGDRMTLADIFLFCFVDFAGAVGQPLSPELARLTTWFARMKERPSAAA